MDNDHSLFSQLSHSTLVVIHEPFDERVVPDGALLTPVQLLICLQVSQSFEDGFKPGP